MDTAARRWEGAVVGPCNVTGRAEEDSCSADLQTFSKGDEKERGSSDEMRWSAGPQDGLGGFSWLRGVPSLVPMLITEKRRHLTKRKARRR
jgi:hypothetical protein